LSEMERQAAAINHGKGGPGARPVFDKPPVKYQSIEEHPLHGPVNEVRLNSEARVVDLFVRGGFPWMVVLVPDHGLPGPVSVRTRTFVVQQGAGRMPREGVFIGRVTGPSPYQFADYGSAPPPEGMSIYVWERV
jgi:hypothetical protein